MRPHPAMRRYWLLLWLCSSATLFANSNTLLRNLQTIEAQKLTPAAWVTELHRAVDEAGRQSQSLAQALPLYQFVLKRSSETYRVRPDLLSLFFDAQKGFYRLQIKEWEKDFVGSIDTLAPVCVKYFPTPLGRRACFRMAQLALEDLNEDRGAAGLWSELLTLPEMADLVPGDLTLLITWFANLGDRTQVRHLVEQLQSKPGTEILLGGRPFPKSKFMESALDLANARYEVLGERIARLDSPEPPIAMVPVPDLSNLCPESANFPDGARVLCLATIGEKGAGFLWVNAEQKPLTTLHRFQPKAVAAIGKNSLLAVSFNEDYILTAEWMKLNLEERQLDSVFPALPLPNLERVDFQVSLPDGTVVLGTHQGQLVWLKEGRITADKSFSQWGLLKPNPALLKDHKTLVFSTHQGHLLTLRNGELVEENSVLRKLAPISNPIVQADGQVLVVSDDGSVLWLHGKAVSHEWVLDPAHYLDPIAVDANTVLIANTRGRLYKFQQARLVWEGSIAETRTPLVPLGRDYFAMVPMHPDSRGMIYIYKLDQRIAEVPTNIQEIPVMSRLQNGDLLALHGAQHCSMLLHLSPQFRYQYRPIVWPVVPGFP